MSQRRKMRKRDRGVAMIVSFALLSMVMAASTAYIDQSTQAIRLARATNYESRGTWLSDTAVQEVVANYWKDFKVTQNFAVMDTQLTGATAGSPKGSVSGSIPDVGNFAAGVIGYSKATNNESRTIVIRGVGFMDHNGNNVADSDEPMKTIDVRIAFSLKRSTVFDYAQFVNNYGWVKGFNENNMIVNGDWRVNGNFELLNGTATINGSVIAANNNKLLPSAAIGLVNKTPYKWDDSKYANHLSTNKSWSQRMRQAYDPAIHGAIGTAEFEKWRELVFLSEAQMVNGRPFGATVQDSNGVRAWKRTSPWAQYKVLDENPTEEIVMPDLSDFGSISDSASATGKRFAQSKAWRDSKATFADGSSNPNFKGNGNTSSEFIAGNPNPNYAGAYVDVWDPAQNKYVRVSSNGVVDGSALLIGTSSKPIRIHGPVTVNGDVAIGGVVEGQGTLYSARNVHILSSVTYKKGPDFRGNNINTIEGVNSKRDVLGLAARGSVMMGDPETFTNYELDHMVPPFTKARKDENGAIVPAWDANKVDSWGTKQYLSLLLNDPAYKDAFKAEAAKGVKQIDAIVYTNNMVGGQAGYFGGGLTINGSMVCKDQAVVAYSGPITMNYDSRIKDRGDNSEPLIDIDLPRGPSIKFLSWQDKGFRMK
jgi:hypothetical protein